MSYRSYQPKGSDINRPYPPVDISLFQESVSEYPALLETADATLQAVSKSPEMMHQLMESAQAGKDEEVNRIIEEASGTANAITTYTPMSVTIIFQSEGPDSPPCCRLTMNLRWG